MPNVPTDTLKDILKDATRYPDNHVITLGNGVTVSLGDLRSLSAADQSALSKREADLTKRQAELEENLKNLQTAQTETARLYAEVTATKERLEGDGKGGRSGASDPLEALENDPVVGGLAKSVRQQRQQLADLADKQLASITKAQQEMARAYMMDRLDDQYDRLVPENKRADIPLDKLLKHAMDNKLATRTGIPDIRRAYQDITTKPITSEDLEKQLADARAAGRREAEESNRLRVPRPGISTGTEPMGRTADQKPFTSLDEAFAAAAKDTAIWAAVDSN